MLLGEARKLLFLPLIQNLVEKRIVIEKLNCFMKLLPDCHQTPSYLFQESLFFLSFSPSFPCFLGIRCAESDLFNTSQFKNYYHHYLSESLFFKVCLFPFDMIFSIKMGHPGLKVNVSVGLHSPGGSRESLFPRSFLLLEGVHLLNSWFPFLSLKPVTLSQVLLMPSSPWFSISSTSICYF